MKTFQDLESMPGCLGAFIEDLPMLTTAHVKPFVIAILLHRGAVKPCEILASLVPHCRADDLKVGGWDEFDNDYCEGTRAEKLVDEVLGEFVGEGILRYNEAEDLWVLTANNLPQIISWVATLGARMPQHILLDLSRRDGGRGASTPWDGTDIEPSPVGRLTSSRTQGDLDDEYIASYRDSDQAS